MRSWLLSTHIRVLWGIIRGLRRCWQKELMLLMLEVSNLAALSRRYLLMSTKVGVLKVRWLKMSRKNLRRLCESFNGRSIEKVWVGVLLNLSWSKPLNLQCLGSVHASLRISLTILLLVLLILPFFFQEIREVASSHLKQVSWLHLKQIEAISLPLPLYMWDSSSIHSS